MRWAITAANTASPPRSAESLSESKLLLPLPSDDFHGHPLIGLWRPYTPADGGLQDAMQDDARYVGEIYKVGTQTLLQQTNLSVQQFGPPILGLQCGGWSDNSREATSSTWRIVAMDGKGSGTGRVSGLRGRADNSLDGPTGALFGRVLRGQLSADSNACRGLSRRRAASRRRPWPARQRSSPCPAAVPIGLTAD